MTVFNKPNTLVYVKRDSLIVAGKHMPAAKLPLSAELVSNLELLEPDKFIATCQEFFTRRGVRHTQVLVVLDASVIFPKAMALEKADDAAEVIDRFVDVIPFEPGQRACIHARNNSQLVLYATNAELYQAVVEALKQSDASKIVAVTPAPAYRLSEPGQFNAAMERFLEDKDVRSRANFLTSQPL